MWPTLIMLATQYVIDCIFHIMQTIQPVVNKLISKNIEISRIRWPHWVSKNLHSYLKHDIIYISLSFCYGDFLKNCLNLSFFSPKKERFSFFLLLILCLVRYFLICFITEVENWFSPLVIQCPNSSITLQSGCFVMTFYIVW